MEWESSDLIAVQPCMFKTLIGKLPFGKQLARLVTRMVMKVALRETAWKV